MRQYQRPTGLPPRSRHYFTTDGTYGDADTMKVFDTTRWTDDDWHDIESASDSERLTVANAIDKTIKQRDVERALSGGKS